MFYDIPGYLMIHDCPYGFCFLRCKVTLNNVDLNLVQVVNRSKSVDTAVRL